MNAILPYTQYEKILILFITLLAFGLRVWHLNDTPPGWRDDELINSLVISQKVLDGEWAVYYPDASGHEALYHILNAGMLGLFGPNMVGIRLLSAYLGTLTIPLTILIGRKLFSRSVGLVAGAGLTFSFWSLMYSRIGLRHVLLPLLTLAAFYFFWRGLERVESRDWRLEIGMRSLISNLQSPISNYLVAALFIGLGFYTYFASRGVPLVLMAFCAYMWLAARPLFKQRWPHLGLLFGVTAVLAIPLLVTLQQQPESEARVAELAVPVVEAQKGNFEPLQRHVVRTLSMFHNDGDDEWLYNIPHRPVFGQPGAVFFWLGVAVAVYHALRPFIWFRPRSQSGTAASLASAFLLIWWLAGISPGFISVPPASLGHTILAQPVTFILAALPVWRLETGDWRLEIHQISNLQSLFVVALGLLFITTLAGRDLPAYFQEWPSRGMVRFLYRADFHEIAAYVNQDAAMVDFGVTGLLAGPWDRVALSIDLKDESAVRPRWYNPERAILLQPAVSFIGFPQPAADYAAAFARFAQPPIGSYVLAQATMPVEASLSICFTNGLCLISAVYDQETYTLWLTWHVARDLDLPPMPLISNPPPPGVYAGPRLQLFAHLLDADDQVIGLDDGLWVDPATLYAGDVFQQQHWLAPPAGTATSAGPKTAAFGLYDPKTGERVLTEDGRDQVRLEIGD